MKLLRSAVQTTAEPWRGVKVSKIPSCSVDCQEGLVERSTSQPAASALLYREMKFIGNLRWRMRKEGGLL